MAFFLHPTQPSFGQQLSQVLSNVGTHIGEGLGRRKDEKLASSIFQIIGNPNTSAIEKTTAFSKLPERYQKHAGQIYAATLAPQASAEAEEAQVARGRQQRAAQMQQNPPQMQQMPQESTQGSQQGSEPSQQQMPQGTASKQEQFDPNDPTSYPDEVLAEEAAYGGLRGRIAQQEQGRRQTEHARDIEALKLTADYREQVLSEYEASKSTLSKLNRLEALGKENKLTTPLMAKLSESLGIPLSVLGNPASEEFQKVSQGLMSNITQTYGNRILQVEVENFLKTIPTLMNSEEGRKRIIDNMKTLLSPSQLAYDEYKKIRKEQGRVPIDLHEQVLERIGPKLDKMAEDFKKNASDFSIVIAPNGEEVRVPRDKVDAAIKAGGMLK